MLRKDRKKKDNCSLDTSKAESRTDSNLTTSQLFSNSYLQEGELHKLSHQLTLQEALHQRMEQEPFVALSAEQKKEYVSDSISKQLIQIEQFQVLQKLVDKKQKLFNEFLIIIAKENEGNACLEENVLATVQQLNAKQYTTGLEKFSPLARVLNNASIRILMDSLESGSAAYFLSFITQEVQRIRQEIHFAKGKEGKEETCAEQIWQQKVIDQMERLRNEAYKQGGGFKGIVERVNEWNRKIPQPLTFAEMQARDCLHGYKENETKLDRNLRERKVTGYPPRKKQIEKKAVAFDLAQTAHAKREKLSKQHCELPDPIRLEMQHLGIRPVSKSRQGFASMTVNYVRGTEYYKTEGFVLPQDKSRSFALEQKTTFPVRKAKNAEKLGPLIARRFELEKARNSEQANDGHGQYDEVIKKLSKLGL